MIESFPTPEALAEGVAREVVARGRAAIAATGRFTLALAGGSTPRAAYVRLAADDLARQLDWRLVHVLWGDERSVPPDDSRSNYRMAQEALLDRVPIPPEQVHRLRGENDPAEAAADYERELRALLGNKGLDLVLLGLGEDGHTASLFPGQAAVREAERWVVAVPPPEGDIWRITLTPAVLNRARQVIFVVSGASKARRLQQVLEGPLTPDVLPVQAIRPVEGRPTWMVDEAAAGRLRVEGAPQ